MKSITLVDPNLGAENVVRSNASFLFSYPCGSKSNSKCTPYKVNIKQGFYKIEVWGAEGGSSNWEKKFAQFGGRGGYSVGAFHAIKETDLYIYIGGKGNDATTTCIVQDGGFNGGGRGGTDSVCVGGSSGGGGGGTDVRLKLDDLNSRIIVAGGGASGRNDWTNLRGIGPYGGGLQGEDGGSNMTLNGKGGAQTKGGETNQIRGASYGSLGKGGNGSTGYSANGGGGGGGGYYGGGGGTSTTDHYKPNGLSGTGGGGSGYIGGVQKLPKWLIVPKTIDGSMSFHAPLEGMEVGHIGHGSCVITILSSMSFDSLHNNSGFIQVKFVSALTIMVLMYEQNPCLIPDVK